MAPDLPARPRATPLALVVQMRTALDALREQVTDPYSPLDAADRAVIASKFPQLAEDLAALYCLVTRSHGKRQEAVHAPL